MMKKNIYILMATTLLCAGLTACGGNQASSNDSRTEREDSVEVGDVVKGELGAFELRGPVKECVWDYGHYKQTYTFDKNGMWEKRDGQIPWEYLPSKRDEKGRIIRIGDGDEYEEIFEYNEQGLRTLYGYHDMERGYKTKYTYDDNGDVITVTDYVWDFAGSGDISDPTISNFKILERDSHGNWTKRDIDGGVVSTRKIKYYE